MLIERYIEETYQLYQLSGRVYPPYFQIHFISVNINAVDLTITQSSHINYFRKEKRQKKQTKKNLQEKQHSECKKNPCKAKIRANFECSPRHAEAKKADRIREESICR